MAELKRPSRAPAASGDEGGDRPTPIEALVVDDERLARSELKRLLAALPGVRVAGEAASVAEAERLAAALDPDLIFLDVEMPDGTGFDLLARLERVPRVIFTTAYDAYAVRAFEVNALDYLLKPVDPARLAVALARLGPPPDRGSLTPVTPTPTPETPIGRPLERIFVRDGARCWLVDVNDVPLFTSEGNYTNLEVGNERPLLARSLSYLEARLDPAHFFRASRQHIVNLRFVASVAPGSGPDLAFVLRDGRVVELSRRQARLLRERLSP